jgi:hypothetical protein
MRVIKPKPVENLLLSLSWPVIEGIIFKDSWIVLKSKSKISS